jgi:hypothetical protein
MSNENAVKGFIIKHYGTYEAMGAALGINVATVGTWTKARPRGILKYAPEMISDVGRQITADEIVETVRIQLSKYVTE